MATSLTFRELANPNTSLTDINAWEVFEVMGGFFLSVQRESPQTSVSGNKVHGVCLL